MDKRQLTISVIIPVYNVENYIVDCLESVVNQTVSFEQIIIINDGSTDNSLSICKQYQEKNSNVFVYNQENQGLAAARNKGMEFVKSEYLLFLDSDDYITKNTVEILQEWLNRERLDIIYYDADILNECKEQQYENHYDRTNKVKSEVMSGPRYFAKNCLDGFPVSACMACFRKAFLDKKRIRFLNVRVHEDEWFSPIAVMEAKAVRYIPERLYIRRYRDGSIMTTSLSKEKVLCFFEVVSKKWEYITKKNIAWTDEDVERLLLYMRVYYYSAESKVNLMEMNQEIEDAFLRFKKRFITCWKKLSGAHKVSLTFFKQIYGFYKMFDTEKDIEIRANVDKMICSVIKNYEDILRNRLEVLPLKNWESRVGIYGTGYHTEQLFVWYQHLFGEVVCDLYFLDTYKETGQVEYMGRPVINIADAKSYVDYIVISSSKYEAEMKDKVQTLFGKSIPIFCFYEECQEDLFVNYEKMMRSV